MPPSIDEIPTAAQLQQQYDVLNNAIAALGNGSTITNLTVSAPPPSGGPETLTMPIPVILNPPIADQTTIQALIGNLQTQADAIEVQLTDMGYAPPAASTLSQRQA